MYGKVSECSSCDETKCDRWVEYILLDQLTHTKSADHTEDKNVHHIWKKQETERMPISVLRI